MHDISPATGSPATVDEREYDPREVRRTFRLLSMDVIFYLGGLAFLDSSTILPAFLATLTGSSIVIGAITAIRPAGAYLPQLWTAHYLSNRRRHKGFLMKVASLSRISIALFALVLFLCRPDDRGLMLWSFLAMYTVFWFSEGGAGVPWTDLVAKTIPERLRGRLFGLTQVVGGVLVVAAGFLIREILSPGGPPYPMNYAMLMGVSAFLFAASYVSLYAVREPDGEPEEHDGDFLDYARKIGRMLAQHPSLKRLLAVQMLIGCFSMSLPFYILYAKTTAGIGGKEVGLLLAVQTAGSIIWSGIAGYVSDHRGPKAAIVASILPAVMAPVIALAIGGSSLWPYLPVFFAVGAINGSGWIGLTNFLLEVADPRERRSYIGVMNTANAPTVVLPVLGGLIAQAASYRTVFALTALALAIALVLALRLRGNDRTRAGVA